MFEGSKVTHRVLSWDDMKTYMIKYESPENITGNDTVIVRANDLVDAQNQFFEFIKKKSFYQHMWKLSMEVHVVEYCE